MSESRLHRDPGVGVQLRPQVTGEGRPLVIQGPGWGPTSDYLRVTLAPLFRGWQVVTYDPRNVADAARVADADAQAVEHLVADLESVRRRLDVQRFVLAGHSHGGFVAMAYAVRHPGRLDGLLLLNTRVRDGHRDEDVEKVLRDFERDPARREAVALFRATSGRLRDATSDAELARQMRKLMPVYFHDLDAMRGFARALRDARPPSSAALARVPDHLEPWVERGLPGVGVPALVLTGRYDVAATPADARHLHGLLSASRLEIFEHSGHHPWVEEPERFTAVTRDFLSAC
jgi:proline iminopeptidase